MARRRQRALEVLGDSRLPIEDLAYMLGFSSAAHFAAAFRQRFGVRPGEYRSAVLTLEGRMLWGRIGDIRRK